MFGELSAGSPEDAFEAAVLFDCPRLVLDLISYGGFAGEEEAEGNPFQSGV